MFRFLVGMVVGFLSMWLFGGSSKTGTQLRDRAREMGDAAQRTAQRAIDKTQSTTERRVS